MGVTDLQNLHNLQDLSDLLDRVEYVWSAWYIHRDGVCTICRICTFFSVGLHDLQNVYDLRYFWVIWRICEIGILHTCLQHVQPGSGLYEVGISRVCTWEGSVLSVHLYGVGYVWSAGSMIYLSGNYGISMICSWTGWGVYDLQDFYDLQEIQMICRICKRRLSDEVDFSHVCTWVGFAGFLQGLQNLNTSHSFT